MGTAIYEQVRQRLSLKPRYENWIGGKPTPPKKKKYFENLSPVTGEVYCEVARGTAEDVEAALDAAHAAKKSFGRTAPAERSMLLSKIADRIEANRDLLALAESWDKGKPIREAIAGDLPIVIDHFRYFAGVCRTLEGSISEIDEHTIAYHYHEPIGVVGAIIPWNFPLVLTAWKMAPALAAGNTLVIKPAEQTPLSIMILMEILENILPPGVVNIVHGFGPEAGAALSGSSRLNKLTFTGATSTGRMIMKAAADHIVPVTLELGGKSPNIFFADIMAKDDGLLEKAVEGLTMFAFNQGEVCTCPSRALVHESIYDKFMARAMKKIRAIKAGNPLESTTMIGAQASKEQYDKILSYIDIGKKEGAELLAGGEPAHLKGDLSKGFYITPTVFHGRNDMKIFQEEVFGPFLSVTTFRDYDEAIAIANDTEYGLSAAVWGRDNTELYRASRDIEAGRVWVNTYHQYPAHASFGGYKQSGIGRENHQMMLAHYQQTKCVLVSHTGQPAGFY